MGKIVATESISLDGVVEDPGGAEDFEYGGWPSRSIAKTVGAGIQVLTYERS